MQSVWNYRSLISVGFGVCLIPIVKRLYSDAQSRKDFMGRHFKFFNAHPYMASYALGVSIRMEEAFAAGDSSACEKLDRIKNLLISILGAVGDNLFWFSIRPFSLLIGVSVLYILEPTGYGALALAGTFLIYNIPHLYLRYKGILEGYEYGEEIYKSFTRQRFSFLRLVYIWVGVCVFLLFLAIFVIKMSTVNFLYLGIVAGACLAYGISFRFTKNFYFSVALTLILNIIAGILIYQ